MTVILSGDQNHVTSIQAHHFSKCYFCLWGKELKLYFWKRLESPVIEEVLYSHFKSVANMLAGFNFHNASQSHRMIWFCSLDIDMF